MDQHRSHQKIGQTSAPELVLTLTSNRATQPAQECAWGWGGKAYRDRRGFPMRKKTSCANAVRQWNTPDDEKTSPPRGRVSRRRGDAIVVSNTPRWSAPSVAEPDSGVELGGESRRGVPSTKARAWNRPKSQHQGRHQGSRIPAVTKESKKKFVARTVCRSANTEA